MYTLSLPNQLDWDKFVSELLRVTANMTVNASEVVIVRTPTYFANLTNVFSAANERWTSSQSFLLLIKYGLQTTSISDGMVVSFNGCRINASVLWHVNFSSQMYIVPCNIEPACVLHSTLENYAKWQFILSFIPALSSDFLSAIDSFLLNTTGHGLRQHNQTCVSAVQTIMPIALARPFTDEILPPGTKVHVCI